MGYPDNLIKHYSGVLIKYLYMRSEFEVADIAKQTAFPIVDEPLAIH